MQITYLPTSTKTFVVANSKTVGTVRRTSPLDTVNMAGREWVAVNRAGQKIPGIYKTRQAAATALAGYFYGV